MSTQQSKSDVETVGLGVKSTAPINASSDQVWAVMIDKMYNTAKYLPVTNVKTTDIKAGQHIFREMVLNGAQVNEDIYFDKARFEIRAEIVDKDEIHFNRYDPDTGLLEYWEENRKGERVQWDVPKEVVLKAMEKIKVTAEASK